MTGGDALGQIEAAVAGLDAELGELSTALHENVETAFEEHQAVAAATSLLARHGFECTVGLAGLPTAFRAVAGAASPAVTVAFICEYDGLPPYGHSCGHNVVTAAGVGAGLALASVAAPELQLQVQVIGTPGEEGGGGKYPMADAGVFAGVDAALMVYPGMHNIGGSRALAARGLEVEFFGKAAHAAAHPELGVNALDAMVSAWCALGLLRQQLPPEARVHGVITDGGRLPMVVPDHTAARLIVRGNDRAMVDALVPRVMTVFEGAATAAGCQAKIRADENMSEALLPNSHLAAAFDDAMAALGEVVRQTDAVNGAWSGDSGYLSHVVPLIQAQVRLTDELTPPHSREFHEAAGAPAARGAIFRAAVAMAAAGHRVAAEPGLAAAIRAEFSDRMSADSDHQPRTDRRAATE